jgi:ABC-type sugar transport system ATPase subunit
MDIARPQGAALEVAELVEDRIVTMREGRVTGEVSRGEATEERLMQLMALGRAEAA